jgi:hypothetical protein
MNLKKYKSIMGRPTRRLGQSWEAEAGPTNVRTHHYDGDAGFKYYMIGGPDIPNKNCFGQSFEWVEVGNEGKGQVWCRACNKPFLEIRCKMFDHRNPLTSMGTGYPSNHANKLDVWKKGTDPNVMADRERILKQELKESRKKRITAN